MGTATRLAVCVLGVLLSVRVGVADEPPRVTAPDREKLDYLFSSWRGRPLEELKTVWGREESIERRGDNETYAFERGRRRAALGLGGIRVVGRGTIVCQAYFRIGLEGIVTRATWRGPSADDCWPLFRQHTPPG
jgi:hypothetical protein